LNAPRRCGGIAGCRAFNLPQGTRARLFAPPRLLQDALVAHDLFGKPVSTFPDHALV
jgi:hypothetical protein